MLPSQFLSAEEQAEIDLFIESLERFCDAEVEPYYRDWEKAGLVDREIFRKMGANGYLCADVPEQYGGPGASVHFSFAVTQVLARRHGFVAPGGGVDVGYSWIEGYAVNARVGARRPDTKDERPVSVGAALNADRLNVEYALGFVAGNQQIHRVTLRWR